MTMDLFDAREKLWQIFDEANPYRNISPDEISSIMYHNWGDKNAISFLVVSLDDPTMISYARKGIEWNDSDRRTKISFRRFCSRYLGWDVNKDPHKSFVDLVEAKLREQASPPQIDLQYSIYTGQQLRDWYGRQPNGYENGGTCMTGMNARYMELMAQNPTKVQLLVGEFEPKKGLRALIWKCSDDITYLDKMYYWPTKLAPNPNWEIKFIEWAKTACGVTHGYHRDLFKCDGAVILCTKGITEYPYMDSFRYGVVKKGQLYEFSLEERPCDIILDQADGGFSPGNDIECDHCGEMYPENEIREINGNMVCEHCKNEYYGCCADCGDYDFIDSMTFLYDEPICTTCLAEGYTECNHCDEYRSNEDIIYEKGQAYCNDCHANTFEKCEDCNEFILIPEVNIGTDGCNRCTECHLSFIENEEETPCE